MKNPHALLPEKPYATYAEYLKATGPSAPAKARKTDPEELLAEVERSGLRGRGGAGFPTGTKWRSVRSHACRKRAVVCNAAEGEPGTFKDRFLLRRNPYAVLEGMIVAARVVETSELVIAIKRSFAREIDRLRKAAAELGDAGALEGLALRIVEGPEEYLFGEEKALLNVIDGEGPLPREAHNPPYEVGLKPTPESPNPALVNNVETFSHVPAIVRHGAASFRKLGTPDTPGTILVTLSGDVARPGVYEVPAGQPLRELLYRMGDGPKSGRTFKAVLSGVSAGVITPDKFETRCDFGSLKMIGSGLGSAGFVVLDDRTSLPRVAQALARFLYVESCNQCTACKHGLRTASTALDALFDPKSAGGAELERALFGARSAPQANRCYLPVQGAQLLPGLVARFKPEFDLQAAKPGARGPKWSLPKFIDFDEDSRTFILDSRQAMKNPDWTYLEPKKTTARFLVSAPAAEPEGEAALRLPPDLYESMRHLAETKGIDVDRQVEEALRQWLKGKRT
jgi:NADH-quinone oxidoreductase subunit F